MKKFFLGLLLLSLLFFVSILFMDKGVINSNTSFEGVSSSHIFGFDSYGRDLFGRVCYGTVVSIGVGVLCSIFTILSGIVFGFFISYSGKLRFISLSIVNSFRSFPTFILSLFLVLLFGNEFWVLIFSISFSGGISFSRQISSLFDMEKNSDENFALKALGLRRSTILFKNTLLNILPYIREQFFLSFLSSFLTESSLSFLGLGLNVTTPTLGGIISEGKDYIFSHPHIVFFPLFIILFISFCLLLISSVFRNGNSPFKRKR